MYRREVCQNRVGDVLILSGINPRICQQCLLNIERQLTCPIDDN